MFESRIITNVQAVAAVFEEHKKTSHAPLIATSGGFDPLHVGHLRCIKAASMLKGEHGLFVIIVNGDNFLMRKKGYVFMPIEERMELIASIKGVDYVVPWDDGTQFVSKALDLIKPNIFAKGGDRKSPEDVPEYETCCSINCAVVFGIGGDTKLQSSSKLVEKMQKPKKR